MAAEQNMLLVPGLMGITKEPPGMKHAKLCMGIDRNVSYIFKICIKHFYTRSLANMARVRNVDTV
jgi:hypothetical protein